MHALLWMIPALPFAGFLILALCVRIPRRAAAIIGSGTIGLAALVTLGVAFEFLSHPPDGGAWTQRLWTWWHTGGMDVGIAFRCDPLALVFTLVVTVVGFLIHVYSTEYMRGDASYNRFFATMNLFVGVMLTLVLADSLPLLYLGWEGVGLCSFLLIGFWYEDPANGRAARKAFIVTRVGDTAMAIGLFLLFWNLGTLHIQDLLGRAAAQWPAGSALPTAAALLLLGGAVGKSAQLPLQTWLPDAMAGPTPVSALIHAATMVTAGVYLIARMYVVFSLAPAALTAVAIVGALTLLLAGCSALVQSDIKRVLAYSTISQIGYMFLALGVGAWSAAVFHFMTHAFFKALLFMGAGAVILALHHEQDIFRMGGLRRALPVVYWTFLAGAASLAALPLVTAGFYSKDLILWEAWSSPAGSRWLWAAGVLGALLTALYTFRLVFLVFHGELRARVEHRHGRAITLPLVVLAVLALIGGFVEIPPTIVDSPAFSRFLEGTFEPAASLGAGDVGEAVRAGDAAASAPESDHLSDTHASAPAHAGRGEELTLQLIAAAVTLAGLFIAYQVFLRRRERVARWSAAPLGARVHHLWFAGWGFDALYDWLFVRPYVWIARVNRADVFDAFYTALARGAVALHAVLARTQTGRIRAYATGIVIGTILALAVMVFGWN
jgi:NADH-quinone oxidoreductase subunit L